MLGISALIPHYRYLDPLMVDLTHIKLILQAVTKMSLATDLAGTTPFRCPLPQQFHASSRADKSRPREDRRSDNLMCVISPVSGRHAFADWLAPKPRVSRKRRELGQQSDCPASLHPCCRYSPADSPMDLCAPAQQHQELNSGDYRTKSLSIYPSIHAFSTTTSLWDDNDLTGSSHIIQSSPVDSALSSALSYISSTSCLYATDTTAMLLKVQEMSKEEYRA